MEASTHKKIKTTNQQRLNFKNNKTYIQQRKKNTKLLQNLRQIVKDPQYFTPILELQLKEQKS
jgi:hypothetical protein